MIPYANLGWQSGDVQTLRPDWTDEQCEAWLDRNEKYIRDAMCEAGWATIETLLEME